MNPLNSPGLIPPRPGLEREEPELADEDDIPPDDSNMPDALPAESEERQQQVERE
jgi:hypothetical protein